MKQKKQRNWQKKLLLNSKRKGKKLKKPLVCIDRLHWMLYAKERKLKKLREKDSWHS